MCQTFGTPNFIKSVLLELKIQIKINPSVVGDFIIQLSSSAVIRTKMKQETSKLKHTVCANGLNEYLQNIPPKLQKLLVSST